MGTLKDLLGEIKDINEEDPYIDEHLKPAVANEFGSVTFDAKVDGDNFSATWYKNGEEIHRHPRYRTSVRRCWYTLKIRDLKKTDSGIYTVVCRNNSSYATSQATLHVIPEKRPGINGANIGTGFFRPRPQLWIEITHHLRCLTVQRGDPILLRVEIRKHPDAQPSFSWYKNNRVSNPVADESTEAVGDDNSFAEYVKYNSEVTDSGIYTVLISNDEIVLSSSAEVVVMDPDFQHDELILNIGNPCFIQPLPDELDVFETEEVTMLCKTLLEMSTELYFFKDEKKLEGDDNITFGEYEGRGLIINIKRATVKDSGIYNVVIRNKDNKRIANTQCILTVNPAPQERIPQVNLVEPLTIVISSIGHKVCLRCTFNMPKTDLFYVVWRVGFYEIERDTPQFKLISNEDGIYSIMIKALDPDMFGEVTCQLRYMIPTKNSIQVAITKGLLIQVPPEDLQEDVQDMLEKSSVVTVEMDFNRSAVVYRAASDDTPQREHHHRHQDLKVTFHPDGDDEGKQDEAVALPEPVPKVTSGRLIITLFVLLFLLSSILIVTMAFS